MVRQGVLAFLVCGLMACTTDVDDPANFTAGNTQGNSGSSSSGGANTDGNTSGMTSAANGTTTSGAEDDTGNASTGGNTSPPGNCGNGVIDAGEQCDGTDLQGFDCMSLGLSGGTLACDDVTCTFDTSLCSSNPGTSG